MGAAARMRVENFFTLEACVRRYLNLYIGIVTNDGVPVARLINSNDKESAISTELNVLTRAGADRG